MDKKESGEQLVFPCEFIIKVFGMRSDEFEINVLTIIRKNIPTLQENALSPRLSKDGKYLALSIKMHIHSREQLDAIYNELSKNPHILMVL